MIYKHVATLASQLTMSMRTYKPSNIKGINDGIHENICGKALD